MKIAISGASGFVGTHIKNVFLKKGYQIVSLDRRLFEPDQAGSLREAVSGCEVVINLAGAPINHRWTKSYKQQMRDSRVGVTQKLVAAINSLESKPSLMISASAVGYYPSQGCFDEYSSTSGEGYLSSLCVEWEKEAQKVAPEVRLVSTRFGLILAPKGGAFEKMAKPAKMGMATIVGDGTQPFPWIDLEDHGRAIEFIINHPELKGVVNLVAPQLINNAQFTKALADRFKCPITVKIPKIAFRLLMGEASSLLLLGQCVKPTKLIESGFEFTSKSIVDFLQKKL